MANFDDLKKRKLWHGGHDSKHEKAHRHGGGMAAAAAPLPLNPIIKETEKRNGMTEKKHGMATAATA